MIELFNAIFQTPWTFLGTAATPMARLYGESKPAFAKVSAGVWMESYRQARLMKVVLEKAMADYAGRPEETLLAKWHGEAVYCMGKSQAERWRGWEDTYPVEPSSVNAIMGGKEGG